jgi:hypothetical protein
LQTRQVVALVTVIAIIALALGTTIGYGISSGRTTTSISTQTQTMTAYVTPNHSSLTHSTQSAETLTEIISLSVSGVVTQYVIGTCTGGGAAYVSMTSTSYIEPVNVAGYFNATIITISNSTYIGSEYLTTITTTTMTGTTCPVYG